MGIISWENRKAEDVMLKIYDQLELMNFVKVTEMLSKAYWSEGIQLDEVIRGAENSAIVVGAFLSDEQIGYARAVSDKTRFAYLMDVYVDDRYRKQGIGQKMVNHILNHETLKAVYIWVLTTSDAHGVYEKCGFKTLAEPQRWMGLRKARPV